MTESLADGDFEQFHAVYTAAYSRPYDSPWLAVEKRVNLTDDLYGTKHAVVARGTDGRIVAGGTVVLPLRDNVTFAYLDVFTHPDHRRAGHASTVLSALLDLAGRAGRSTAILAAYWGLGVATSEARRFAEARGFTLDTVDAARELALPAQLPPLRVAKGYRLQTWRGPCPDELIEEYAELRHLLVSEAPSGDAGLENEFWDADRVRRDEADLARADRIMQVTVAHAPGGGLAGHTQLSIPGSGPTVYQWDTLVRPAHRGHALGLALKVSALHEATDLLVGKTRVVTENAASNAPMIAVNEVLGFRQTAWVGEFIRPI